MIEKLKTVFQVDSRDDFLRKFATGDACAAWLSLQKWKDGYSCRKCGHTNCCVGNTPYSRRCTRCKYLESATAYTVFHKCKIPLQEAFAILFSTYDDPKPSIRNLSKTVDVRSMTCWRLRQKFDHCLSQGDCNSLFGGRNAQ